MGNNLDKEKSFRYLTRDDIGGASDAPGIASQGGEISPDLLRALRAGDHVAFEKIYFHYSDSINRFLQLLTRSEELADDITQETFIAVWERREQIDLRKNIKTYLYTIARNTAITHFNREKLRDKYAWYMSGVPEGDAATSEEVLIGKETEILIRIAVSRMPKLRRRVFELSHYEGWPKEKIADELKINTSNVYDHLYQANKDIKEVLMAFLIFISVQ